MKKLILLLGGLTLSNLCYGQEPEQFARKISDDMCTCIGNTVDYEVLESKFNLCYDRALDSAIEVATPSEIAIVADIEQFGRVKRIIEPLLKTECEPVRESIARWIQSVPSEMPFPTNFGGSELRTLSEIRDDRSGIVVALEGEVVEVIRSAPDRMYMRLKIDEGSSIWVGSMAISDNGVTGSRLKALGYLVAASGNGIPVPVGNEGHIVVAFAEVNLVTGRLAMAPGAERQVREWKGGSIPSAR